MLFYVLFVLCRSMYCLCVYVYCTTTNGRLPNCSQIYHIIYHISYHIICPYIPFLLNRNKISVKLYEVQCTFKTAMVTKFSIVCMITIGTVCTNVTSFFMGTIITFVKMTMLTISVFFMFDMVDMDALLANMLQKVTTSKCPDGYLCYHDHLGYQLYHCFYISLGYAKEPEIFQSADVF